MKSLRIWNVYIYLFFAVTFMGVISPWLWFLSGTSPLSISDPHGRLSGLAGYFGGVELLASLGWLLMALSISSWLAIVIMVLVFLYRFFCGHRAGDAIDDLLLFAPSMPDGLAVAELSKYGVRIEEKEGDFCLYIQRRYWRLAWPEALAHSVTYLLYLHAQIHLEDLLNDERTLFHDLAELLNKNYDEKAIDNFKTQMADDDSVCGILLDVALRQIELREEIAELQKKLAKEDELQRTAVAVAQLELVKKTKRIDRIAPIKPAKSPEEAVEKTVGVESAYIDLNGEARVEDKSGSKQPTGLGSLPANQTPLWHPSDSQKQSEVPFGSLSTVVARYPGMSGVLSADQVGVEGVSQQVIDDFREASIGGNGESAKPEVGSVEEVLARSDFEQPSAQSENLPPAEDADKFERPEEGHEIRNVVCGSDDQTAPVSVHG